MTQVPLSALEGELGNGQLMKLLLRLQAETVTGIVTVQGGQEIVAISVLNGDLVSADALNRSLDDGLGEVLLREGWVRPEELGGLVAEQQVGGGRVMDLLLERGYLERPQLLRALRLHVYDLLLEVFRWREGEYRFYAGDEVSYEDGIEPIPVQEVLVRASRDLGEDGPLPELFSVDTALERSSVAADKAPGSAGEGLLLELLAHPRTPGQLIRESGFSEYQTLFRLDRLRESGLVRVVSPSAEAELGLDEVERALADTDRVLELEEQQERLQLSDEVIPGAEPSRFLVDWEKLPLAGLIAGLWLVVFGWLAVGGDAGIHDFGSLLEPLRPSLNESLTESRLQSAVRGARVFAIATGALPEDLGQLASRDLIGDWALRGASDSRLELSARDSSFVVGVDLEGDRPVSRTHFLAGDLVLDNSFDLAASSSQQGPALVLLD